MTECTFAEYFGATFKRLRKDAKLSQQEVATKGGFDRSYVTLIELGKKNPTMSVIEKMASIVSLSVGDFFSEFVKDIGLDCDFKRVNGYCSMHGAMPGVKAESRFDKNVPNKTSHADDNNEL